MWELLQGKGFPDSWHHNFPKYSSLRKEGYTQKEIDHLYNSILLSKIMRGLPVYVASASDLTVLQHFLTRCFK